MHIETVIYQLTPPIIWNVLKKAYLRIHTQEIIKGRFWCPVCKKNVIRFRSLPPFYDIMSEKYPSVHPTFMGEMMNTHAYTCPHCGETDRGRAYAMLLEKKFQELKSTGKEFSFLDFAPSKPLQNFIKKHPFIQYKSADLYMDGVDDKVDITNMGSYKNESFDIILCSHVLEHVRDDRKAMSELHRVLKSNGFAIVVVPINLGLTNDFEDPTKTSKSDCWKYFGQDDHVRVYSKQGFVTKLEEVGFKVHQYGIDYFGMAEFERCGIHPRSVIYVVSK